MSGHAFAAKTKVAFALLWTIDDQGWTTSHYRGIEHLKKEFGPDVEVAYVEKIVAPSDAERTFRTYAERGYELVFGTTFSHMDPMLTVAKEFPNVAFEHCSGYKTAANMGTYFVRIEQAEFLAGYMAGLMGFKNVGTVATQPIPEVVRGINAFTLGLRKGLDEKKIPYDPAKLNTIVWLKEWRDPINETLLAETLAARKHDLIRQMADTPDSAKAACAAGVPAIGYGEDAARYGASCTLVSTVFNWGPIYAKLVKQVRDKTWKPEEYWRGFDEDAIALSEFHASVPAEVREKVLAQRELMRQGQDDSFAGPILDQTGQVRIPAGQKATDKELLGMRWLVQGVHGSVPD
jgi:basic membrane lipoprotein Med (substrate-binding protein (PBP1-ABC) superfamily)